MPIFKRDAIYSLYPSGDIADYAVVMKRMKVTLQMDNLLKSKKVTTSMVISLARKIAAFHQGAEVISGKYDVASLQKRFNDMAVIEYMPDKIHSQIIQKAIKYSDNFLSHHKNIFLQREAEGFVRDVHGDLHTGNVFLYRDPVIFDCIEFNDDMRMIDVLDEVAFLCMDLESYGRKDLSDLFYKYYLEFSGAKTTETTELIFRYFKLYRANIRAKVSMIASQNDLNKRRHISDNSTIDRYLNLIQAYLKRCN
ncbi:MAG: hypothetical protein JST50_21265 [Bacteroidetes bacterium]|nr:hypothetical protein [Bacteroidota bacterium]